MFMPEVRATPHRLSTIVAEWVQRVAEQHFAEGGSDDDSELSTDHYPLAASLGPVRPHIDEFDGAETGKTIYGLVLRSDGHMLHSHSRCGDPERCGVHGTCETGLLLREGDVYQLDPHDRHWTSCFGDGILIFAAAFIEHDDPRHGHFSKMGHDLLWETIHAYGKAVHNIRMEEAAEKYRYRGIGEE